MSIPIRSSSHRSIVGDYDQKFVQFTILYIFLIIVMPIAVQDVMMMMNYMLSHRYGN